MHCAPPNTENLDSKADSCNHMDVQFLIVCDSQVVLKVHINKPANIYVPRQRTGGVPKVIKNAFGK